MEITRHHRLARRQLADGTQCFAINHRQLQEERFSNISNYSSKNDAILVERDSLALSHRDSEYKVTQQFDRFAGTGWDLGLYGLWADSNNNQQIEINEVDNLDSIVGKAKVQGPNVYTTKGFQFVARKRDGFLSEVLHVAPSGK